MLELLHLQGVGPAAEFEFRFGPRINLVTGDNGLGKTFVLDLAWWSMTRTWVGHPARPRVPSEKASIEFSFHGRAGRKKGSSVFDAARQTWPIQPGRPANPGMVIYARVDGSFSVWDPARNYWKVAPSMGVDEPDRPAAYHFSPRQIWDGLREDDKYLCNGLILDWVSWQKEKGAAFDQLSTVLEQLSSSDDEPLRPGRPARVSLDDVRDIPTVAMPYGEVPLVYAAAGVRRIAALAYLLVWTWQEHLKASELIGEEPTTEVTFLIDEVEAHLHPRWQRAILPALLGVMGSLASEQARVQVIAATHAPLLLASMEPSYDEEQDRVFTFDLCRDSVSLREVSWSKQGDVVGWLVSDVFGLRQARSREAEQAIEAAEAFMRNDVNALPAKLATRAAIHAELRRVLPGHDPFWPRWVVDGEQRAR